MIRQIFHCIYCRIVADTGFIEQLMIIEIGIGFILHRSIDRREKTRSLLRLVCGSAVSAASACFGFADSGEYLYLRVQLLFCSRQFPDDFFVCMVSLFAGIRLEEILFAADSVSASDGSDSVTASAVSASDDSVVLSATAICSGISELGSEMASQPDRLTSRPAVNNIR